VGAAGVERDGEGGGEGSEGLRPVEVGSEGGRRRRREVDLVVESIDIADIVDVVDVVEGGVWERRGEARRIRKDGESERKLKVAKKSMRERDVDRILIYHFIYFAYSYRRRV